MFTLIFKQPFAKYFHYKTLECYMLLRQIWVYAIIINQLSMSELLLAYVFLDFV